jgi:Ca2+-binding RTX toxin-like protein
LGVLAVIATGVLSAPAFAASTVHSVPRENDDGEVVSSDITLRGDDGVNNVTLTPSGDDVLVSDTSGLTAADDDECTQVSPTSVRCPKADYADAILFAGNDVFSADPSLIVNVEAGEGNDSITGRTGNANTFDDEGVTFVDGEEGNDTITVDGNAEGSHGDDTLTGGDRDDLLDGGFGDDTLTGGAGDDELIGGDVGGDPPGSDELAGGAGDDLLTGGAASFQGGDDTEDDDVDGGDGIDTLDWAARNVALTVDLANPAPDGAEGERDKLTNIENVNTGSGDDTIVAAETGSVIDPGGGADSVTGGDGDDFVQAGDESSDTIALGGGSDTVSYEEHDGPVTVNLADAGADGPRKSLDSLSGIENAIGTAKRDVLVGDAQANVLAGLNGRDTIDGGLGDDTISGGRGRDVADYSSRTTGVDASVGRGGGEGSETDRFSGIEGIRGGSGDDNLTGRKKKRDHLVGGPGADTLRGKTGKDRLFGNAGRDRLDAADGQKDRANCGSGRDQFWADDKDKLRGCERRGEGPGPAPAVCTSRASAGCVLPPTSRRT